MIVLKRITSIKFPTTRYVVWLICMFYFLCNSCNIRNQNPEFIKYPNQIDLINSSFVQTIDSDSIIKKPVKIIVWADSVGCTGCKLQLDTWEYIIKDLNHSFPNKIDYVFFLQFEDREEMEYLLGLSMDEAFMEDLYSSEEPVNYEMELDETELEVLHYPIYWDPKGDFGTTNNIEGYKCFIVDSINRIVLKADPPFISEDRYKYKQVIKLLLD